MLAELCRRHPAALLSAERLPEMLALLNEGLGSVPVAAKTSRLQCLRLIVSSMCPTEPKHVETLPPLLAEVLLCTKEANSRAREAAFRLLIQMARTMQQGGTVAADVLRRSAGGDGVEDGDGIDAEESDDAQDADDCEAGDERG